MRLPRMVGAEKVLWWWLVPLTLPMLLEPDWSRPLLLGPCGGTGGQGRKADSEEGGQCYRAPYHHNTICRVAGVCRGRSV